MRFDMHKWGILLLLFIFVGCGSDTEITTEKVFNDSSDKLTQTKIVPTLDTPMPEGNVIWCSTFQLAWNELKNDIIKSPIQLTDPVVNAIAQSLNNAKQGKNDLDTQDYYAKAGYVADGIIETIKQEMAAKFPDYDTSHLIPGGEEIIWAYSYLNVRAKFTEPFMEQAFTFINSDGTSTNIEGFGLRESYRSGRRDIARQIDVLYFKEYDEKFGLEEFIIDPCKFTSPYQVILACVEPMDTLNKTIAYIETKIEEFKTADIHESEKIFSGGDELSVPVTCWKIEHDYKKLIGVNLKNKGFDELFIGKALQDISFRLDRSGAFVVSEGNADLMECQPRDFKFNRPFMIYLKKRDGGEPFFAMWVDNAELLNK
ncbi:MAG: hypothetical protein JEZ07_03965 [Phycisphaerae bacterium]|nr:hypothetical protein [Phycisphaerae bacterium]